MADADLDLCSDRRRGKWWWGRREFLADSLRVQILLYDHLLTLKDEVELVWKARLTVAQVLFLILRYLPLIGVIIENIRE